MHRVILDSVLHRCSQPGKIKLHCGVIGSMIMSGRKVAGVICIFAREGQLKYSLVPRTHGRWGPTSGGLVSPVLWCSYLGRIRMHGLCQ